MAMYGCNVLVTLSPADAMSCVVNFLMSSADSCVGMLLFEQHVTDCSLTLYNAINIMKFHCGVFCNRFWTEHSSATVLNFTKIKCRLPHLIITLCFMIEICSVKSVRVFISTIIIASGASWNTSCFRKLEMLFDICIFNWTANGCNVTQKHELFYIIPALFWTYTLHFVDLPTRL